MKRLFGLIALLIVFVAAPVWAQPYLVCDPQEAVETYEVDINGVITTLEADPTGEFGFKMDLADIQNGIYNAKARAGNIWGWSEWSVPFGFVVQRCGPPQNIRLSR